MKNPVPGFKVDSLRTVNKSCNKTNSPEEVQTMCSAKKKALSVTDKEKELSVADKDELSVAAFKGLLSKRDILASILALNF